MRVKHLTIEQHAAILSQAQANPSEPASLLFAVLAVTGMRCDELAKITWSDLDKQSGAVAIRGSKRSFDRQLHLPTWLVDALLNHSACSGLADNNIMELLSSNFSHITTPRQSHNAKQCLRDHWRAIRSRLGCKTMPLHSLRHAVAMRMLEKTDNIRRVAAVLGHKNINNTIKYLDYVNSLEASKDLLGIFADNQEFKKGA
jgi:integrase